MAKATWTPPTWYLKGQVTVPSSIAPGYGEYSPGSPGFLNLVNAAQGNAGDSSDGFDSALAAVMALEQALAPGFAALDPALAAISSLMDDFDALTDPLEGIIAVATALADADEAFLGASLLAGISIPGQPSPFVPPNLPQLTLDVDALTNAGAAAGTQLSSVLVTQVGTTIAEDTIPGGILATTGSVGLASIAATLIPVIGAFVAFNEFLSYIDGTFASWAAAQQLFCEEHPITCAIQSLESIMAPIQQQLNSGQIPPGERANAEAAWQHYQDMLNALNAHWTPGA